jgi:hypothetical protein
MVLRHLVGGRPDIVAGGACQQTAGAAAISNSEPADPGSAPVALPPLEANSTGGEPANTSDPATDVPSAHAHLQQSSFAIEEAARQKAD